MKMGSDAVSPLVSVEWLKEKLDLVDSNVVVLDTSYDLNRSIEKEYMKGHIPEAVFFDIKECRDKTLPYPNMLPPPQVFAHFVGQLGIDNSMHVVVYDNNARGLFSATRVLWMFRAFGHDKVSLLNGGLAAWKEKHFHLSSDRPYRPSKIFHATLRKDYVLRYEEVAHIVKGHHSIPQLVDARPPILFAAGHIPKAKSMPYFTVLNDPPMTTLKDEENLQKAFVVASIDLDQRVVFHCNSDVSLAGLTGHYFLEVRFLALRIQYLHKLKPDYCLKSL